MNRGLRRRPSLEAGLKEREQGRDGVRLHWLFSFVTVAACASTEVLLQGPPDGSVSVPEVTEADGGQDGGQGETERLPCADCEFFPDVCSPDVLCPNGPFDPTSADGHLAPGITISTIRGRSVSDVWAVGALGAVAHFDGTSWATSDVGSQESLRSLWLRDDGELAFGYPSRVYTHGLRDVDGGGTPSGGGWSLNVPNTRGLGDDDSSTRLWTSWGASDAKWFWMTVTSSNYPGLWRMTQLPSGALEAQAPFSVPTCRIHHCAAMYAIHGASADELWAVGPAGFAVRISGADGDTPTVKAFNSRTFNALSAVWAASTSDVWAVGGEGTIRHYTGDPVTWDVVSGVPTTGNLKAVWGSSSADIWAVGDAGLVLHYDGQTWSRVKVAGQGLRRPNLTTVWVAAPGHVWVGGEGVILSLGGKP